MILDDTTSAPFFQWINLWVRIRGHYSLYFEVQNSFLPISTLFEFMYMSKLQAANSFTELGKSWQTLTNERDQDKRRERGTFQRLLLYALSSSCPPSLSPHSVHFVNFKSLEPRPVVFSRKWWISSSVLNWKDLLHHVMSPLSSLLSLSLSLSLSSCISHSNLKKGRIQRIPFPKEQYF